MAAGIEVLSQLEGRRWLVFADMAELGDYATESHREVGAQAKAAGIERLFATGTLAKLAVASFGADAEWFADTTALAAGVNAALARVAAGSSSAAVRMLVKGSRFNHLEQVVAALVGPAPAGAGNQRNLTVLYLLTQHLTGLYSGFNVFSYLTLRAILACMSSLVFSLLIGPSMIARLSQYQIGQVVRSDGPKSHLPKAGTPTMGGALILVAVAVLFGTLLWANVRDRFVWTVLGVTFAFGLIGFYDDYLKIAIKNSRGLIPRWKYFWQTVVGLCAAAVLYYTAQSPAETTLFLPFVKRFAEPLSAVSFITLGYLMIVGMSNAVNLTDGLDGLAIMPAVMVSAALGVFAYASGNAKFAEYLAIPAVPRAGELLVFCAALSGAGLGFLWFNTYPAQVFMGDVGALAIGGALGVVAVIVRQELVALIMGGIFVIETASVILQVASFKLTGKRIFRMAPIHHHFELKGWAEPKVIVRFWILSLLLVLLGLATLKVR